ncbi:MAG: hypothetical protein HZB86_03060 [Deltaproteobacteria bacterium]|nr:hypothetical protein [Deltaproteobacteria bacterium]
MAITTNRNPARRVAETSSLLGLVEFRPRMTIVLVFLTITVAVVGWRFSRDAGSRRVDIVAREAVELYTSVPASEATVEPADAEKKILDLSGVALELPREEPGFTVAWVRRAVLGKHPGAAVRFRYSGDAYLLVVFRQDRLLGNAPPAAVPEESFLSGERDGKSFVFWERDGATFIAVSDADVTRTFEMVRLCFT